MPVRSLHRLHLEKSRPTLLVDEVDTFLKENDEARGILNCGHSRGTAYVMRVVGEGANMEPQKFSTWGAKALCGIGTLKDTLTSRSIIIKMRRKKPDENVKPLRESQKSAHSHIRKMLVRFALDNADKVADAPDKELEMPTSLCDRDQDNWEPLFAIAEVVGGDWPKLARKAAEALSKKDDDSIGATLLGDIKAVFDDKGVNKLSTKDLIAALSEFEGKPWPEYNHGKEITPRQLARPLKPYDIKPKTERVGGRGGLVFKGYELSSFQDALSRYLPENAVTRLHGGGAELTAFLCQVH